MTIETKIRKAPENLSRQSRYDIIDDYIYSRLSNREIAEKYGTTDNNVGLIVSRHFKSLANVRETKLLLDNPSLNMKQIEQYKEILDVEKINGDFLNLLSDPEDLVLTDNEAMFCELYNDDGNEIRALEEAKLNVGLKRGREVKDRDEYKQSLTLRAFYLKRKPNVARYLAEIQRKKIQRITNGKEFIQVELLSVIERLKTCGTPQALSSYLKAVEALGRTYNAFSDSITIENISGDNALDLILKRAKEAKAKVIEQENEEGIGSAA